MASDNSDIQVLIADAVETLGLPATPSGLYDPIRYTLASGGKRLRPTLLLAVVQALGGDVKAAMPQALGIEMFHNFTLLHDDVMDNADVRRGRPTVHRRWDCNTAILSGDAMLTASTQLTAECPISRLKPVLDIFNRTAMQVYEGQQLDMDFEHRRDVTVDEYMEMIRLKTSVLLACACAEGALLCNADDETVNAFYQFGEALGLAFQLQDDYLDTFGDPLVFGKQTGGDILNDKKTWLLITALAEDSTGTMQRALDGDFNETDKVNKVTEVYRNLGLEQRIATLIDEYSTKALEALARTNLTVARLKFFTELTESLQNRSH